MPWRYHPSAADMQSPDDPAVDQEQRRVLQGLNEDPLSYIETTSDGRSSAASNVSFQRLFNTGLQWWRDDNWLSTVDFPDITEVSGTNPCRCLNGECSEKVVVFTCRSALQKHLFKHIPSGMRPFVCLECPVEPTRMEFTYAKDLERHFLKIHNVGERKTHLEPTKCDVCGRDFSRKDGLKRHQDKFGSSCVDAKRARRKSAPATNISMGRQDLSISVDQLATAVDSSHHISASTASSSRVSGASRPSARTSHRRQTTSTATGLSVHFSLELSKTPQAAEILPENTLPMPWSEGLPSG